MTDLPQNKRRAPSTLSPGRRYLLVVILILGALMLANVLYLLANRFADQAGWRVLAASAEALPRFFQIMLLSHTGLGILLLALVVVFVVWHLKAVWPRKRPATLVTGLLSLVAMLGLTLSGAFLLTAAATRSNAWAWWMHIALAAILPLAYIVHRLRSVRPLLLSHLRRYGLATGAAAIGFLAVHMVLPKELALTPEAQTAKSRETQNPAGSGRYYAQASPASAMKFVPASDVPIESPFFPAATTTTTGTLLPNRLLLREHASLEKIGNEDFSKFGFVVNERIGADSCVRCHADVVEQWAASAHRFSSFNNPFYEATINDMRKTASRDEPKILAHMAHFGVPKERLPLVRSKWCSSCHDPALMIPGNMSEPIERESPAAQAGLTCLACHNIDGIHNTTGNGHYNVADEQEDPYLFAKFQGGLGEFLHDAAVKARPEVHKRQMLKPVFRTAEFCSACHKVNLDTPVNAYRWIRGQNEYDAWHDSGVARNASRTFYMPAASRQCQDCHMPPEPAVRGDVAAKDGMVRSHRFLAVNTALPFVRDDHDSIRRIEAFLRDDKLRVDVFAVREVKPEGDAPSLYPADQAQLAAAPGATLRVDVVVRNRNVGHTFPGGTNDSNESWLEFSVRDSKGKLLAISGAVGEDGHVDANAHFYRVIMVNREGERIFRRDAQNIYAPVYVNVIGPGTADLGHFQFTLPQDLPAGETLTVEARLLWRKFDRFYTEFAYRNNPEGFARFQDVPDLPITEIGASKIQIRAQSEGGEGLTGSAAPMAEKDWMRLNDYGIGLLLEGDTRAAIEVFERLCQIAPKKADGYRNLARAYRVEGSMDAAIEALYRAEELAPADVQTAWVWGQVWTEKGRYEAASAAYQRILRDFPNDRASARELAVVHYRHQQFEQSLSAADRVLAIDPEDRIAHYYRMLSFEALGRSEEARQARIAYEKYQIDESAQEVTQAYRLKNPGDNLESQPLHTHRIEIDFPTKAKNHEKKETPPVRDIRPGDAPPPRGLREGENSGGD